MVYRELDIKKEEKHDKAVPMDSDHVKGKMKGKQKGKHKGGKDSKGRGKRKDTVKVKGKHKGKWKDFGKSSDGRGKGKGLPAEVCKLCGGRGHWSREWAHCSNGQCATQHGLLAASGPTMGALWLMKW